MFTSINSLEVVGWLGSVLFAICGLPQAVQCHKQGHADGLSWVFLMAWFLGEVLTTAYVWPQKDYPLLFNYAMNLAFLTVILRYKVLPRGKTFTTGYAGLDVFFRSKMLFSRGTKQ